MTRTEKVVAGVVAAGSFGFFMAAASAGQPTPTVRAHQHYTVTADGDLVRVGPNACENGMSIQFDNFHLNGHVGVPGKHGVITGRPCS